MQVYKVLKEFELNNELVKSGEEVAVRAREAEKLMKEGFLTPSDRELDPNEPKDKALIDKCSKAAKDKHDENFSEEKAEARQAEVDEREAQRDEEEAAKAAEAAEATDDSEDDEEEESEEEAQTSVEETTPKKRTRRKAVK